MLELRSTSEAVLGLTEHVTAAIDGSSIRAVLTGKFPLEDKQFKISMLTLELLYRQVETQGGGFSRAKGHVRTEHNVCSLVETLKISSAKLPRNLISNSFKIYLM